MLTETPLISVIIPLYNKEKIVAHTIHSVLNQSFSGFELIVVNDGSTDGSMDVVRAIQDDRIVLVEQENGGPSKARNMGVKQAKGEWILFLDADDELHVDALNIFWKMHVEHPDCNMMCCGYSNCKSGRCYELPFKYEGNICNNFKAWYNGYIKPRAGNTMFAKELLLNNPFDERLRRYEDLDFLFSMFKIANIYSHSCSVLNVNIDYAGARNPRFFIKEDLLGHLDFHNKGFWERMCLYQFYLGERGYYPEEVKKLYPHLHHRYDLLLIYKFLKILRKVYLL